MAEASIRPRNGRPGKVCGSCRPRGLSLRIPSHAEPTGLGGNSILAGGLARCSCYTSGPIEEDRKWPNPTTRSRSVREISPRNRRKTKSGSGKQEPRASRLRRVYLRRLAMTRVSSNLDAVCLRIKSPSVALKYQAAGWVAERSPALLPQGTRRRLPPPQPLQGRAHQQRIGGQGSGQADEGGAAKDPEGPKPGVEGEL